MPLVDTSNTYVSSAYQPKQDPSSKLDKDGFLKMLTEQLKNQDPSSNQDPSQYFQTISQMTLVEQITNLAQQGAVTGAQAMLGKTATYQLPNGTTATGVVQSVTVSGGAPTLTIGDKPGIKPDAVTEIKPS
jgi:flagellar basal-body rod modification protein FlgD